MWSNDVKCKYMFMFPLKNLARKGFMHFQLLADLMITLSIVLKYKHQISYGSCITWWRHQMETFSALLAICAGNSTVPGEFPTQRPMTLSFHVYFDMRLNKRLSKQSWGWWFETPSSPLWCHRNEGKVWDVYFATAVRYHANIVKLTFYWTFTDKKEIGLVKLLC